MKTKLATLLKVPVTFLNIFKLKSQYFTGGLSSVKLANNVIKEKTRGLAPVSVKSEEIGHILAGITY